MAQTKRKRRTKHRGNAAGIVEVRGRTGRKPTEAERGSDKKAQSAKDRMFREPTWKGAVNRSAFAALIFGALVVLAFKQPLGQAVVLTVFVFGLYIPLGYVTDSVLYKRKQRQLAAESAKR